MAKFNTFQFAGIHTKWRLATLTRSEQSEIYDTLHTYAYVHTHTRRLAYALTYGIIAACECGLFVVATSTKHRPLLFDM